MKKNIYFLVPSLLVVVTVLFSFFLFAARILAASDLVIELSEDLDFERLYVNVYSQDESSNISMIEYRVNGGDWQELSIETGFFDSPYENGYIYRSTLPLGDNIIDVRAFDNQDPPVVWPSSGYETIEYAGPKIQVDIYNDEYRIDINAQSNTGSVNINLIEYSLDGEQTWLPIPEDSLSNFYDYPNQSGYLENSDLAPGNYPEIRFRVRDTNSNYWPLEGSLIVNDFSGLTDNISFNLQDWGDSVKVEVYTSGIVKPKFIQYNIEGNGWFNMNSSVNELGSFAEGYLPFQDIPVGQQNIEFRIIDQEYELSWPDGSFGYDSITVEGQATNDVNLYNEYFENGIGTSISTKDYGYFDSSTIGDEWYSQGSNTGSTYYGRLRLHGDGFQRTGDGALTFDSISSTQYQGNELTLTIDYSYLQTLAYSPNVYLNFDFMSHDSNPASFPTEKATNKVYAKALFDDDWTEIYSLNDNLINGEYVSASINLSEALNYKSMLDLQIKFVVGATNLALVPGTAGGYSLDNIELNHVIGIVQEPDETPPVITFNEDPAVTLKSGRYLNLNISDDVSNITEVKAQTFINSSFFDEVIGGPDDGDFNSNNESSTLYVDGMFNGLVEGDSYSIVITARNASNLTIEQTVNGVFDETAPEIVFDQTPQALQSNTLTISGTATDGFSNILYADVIINSIRVIGDGTFDSTSEEFVVQFDSLRDYLPSGNYTIYVEVSDVLGNVRTYEFTGVLDSGSPVLTNMTNFGQAPTENTTPNYTALVCDDLEVANFEYRVFSFHNFEIEIDWTQVMPQDGVYDESCEDFVFNTLPLVDGEKLMDVRINDVAGNETTVFRVDRVIINAVDTTAPIIDLQPILPNPTFDRFPKLQGKVTDDNTDKQSTISSISYNLNGEGWTAITPFDGNLDEITEEFNVSLPELPIGLHEIIVRAQDASGNDTNPSFNQTINFEVRERDIDIESGKFQKTGDFLGHSDHDIIASENVTWGRGRLRLQQPVEVLSQTPLTTTNFGPRYDDFFDGFEIVESQCNGGGFWVTKYQDKFAFYHRATNQEYEFSLRDYGISGDFVISMVPAEYYNSLTGECHVWISSINPSNYQITGINFGSSVIDGLNDTYQNHTPTLDLNTDPLIDAARGINLMLIDDRDPNNYGIWYRYNGGINYLRPGDLSTNADDLLEEYDSSGGFIMENVTSIVTVGNELWFADYQNGIGVINDNGTPLDNSDDIQTYYDKDDFPSVDRVFDIAFTKRGEAVFGGDNGIVIITNDNNTFISSDDTIFQLATTAQLGQDEIVKLEYFDGEDVLDSTGNPIIGEQFYITSRSGQLTVFSTNDTIQDKIDDEVYILDLSMGFYPTELTSILITDSDNITVLMHRLGVYDVVLDREFAANGSAITKIYSTLSGDYLDLDFATLISVSIIDNPQLLSYFVSNDGGFNWLPIEIGGTVNFPNKGYQLAFRIDMQRGSTPIIDNFLLTYSAYQNEAERDLSLAIEDEPPEVYTNDIFTFNVLAFDELSNPYEESENVDIELRRLSDNVVVDSFSVNNATIDNGQVFIDNAQAPVLGLHYLYATNGDKTAVSGPINFIDDSEPTTPTPTVSPTVTPTQTPNTGQTCTENPLQPQCQSIFEITSDNVKILSETSVEICWTTNAEAKGFIKFGRVIEGMDTILDNSVDYTYNYATSFCVILIELDPNSAYQYEITGVDRDGRVDYEDGTFVLNKEIVIPTDVEVEECIGIDQSSYNFNSQNQALINFITREPASCQVFYGNGSDLKYSYTTEPNKLIHTGIIDLNNSQNRADINYRIECNFGTEAAENKCTTSGIIPLNTFTPNNENDGETLARQVNRILETASQVAIPASLTFLTVGTSLINLLAYPRILLYGLGWLKNRKKFNTWGIVFNEENKKPVPFASVKLSSNGKFIMEKITDFDGKYGFPSDPGSYNIEVTHPDFATYKLEMIIEDEQIVAHDVALSQTKKLQRTRETVRDNIRIVNTVIVYSGFIFSIFALAMYFSYINVAIVALYLIQFMLLTFIKSPRNWGIVFDSSSREKINGAFIRLFDPKESRQLDVQMSDKSGRYGFLVKEGDYRISVDASGYKFPSSITKNVIKGSNDQYFVPVSIKRNETINLQIALDKGSNTKSSSTKSTEAKLRSPFGE